MNRWMVFACAISLNGVGLTSVAQAVEHYGSLADAHKCDPELDALGDRGPSEWIAGARKSGKGLSPDCKAELERRIPACEQDPYNKRQLTDPELNHGDAKGWCFDKAFGDVWEQVINDRNDRKSAQEEANAAAAAKAKASLALAEVELPKAEVHDASLEKQVADAYHRYDPPAKILKVFLGRWSSDLEKDAWGRVTGRDLYATVLNKQPDGKCLLHGELWMQHGNGRSFSGPLTARGAGSASDKEILCERAGAGGKRK
jgi:hypothetical protein